MVQKIFYGWWVVVATFIVQLIGVAGAFYTVSVFLEPLHTTFGWSTTQISLAFTIAALLTGLLSPLVGWAVSRIGVRNVQIYGVIVCGISLMALGSIQQLWHYFVLFAFMASGLVCITIVTVQTLISFWFTKKRGIAMGIVMAGVGLGGMLMVFLASQIVGAFGWRWAYRILGCMEFAIVLPMILIFVKNKPQDLGLVPDGVALTATESQQQAAQGSLTLAQGAKSLAFYLLCTLSMIVFFMVGGFTQHAIALLKSLNVARADVFWGLVLGMSVFGRFGFGALADKISKKTTLISVLVFILLGIGSILFLSLDSMLVWGFILFFGCGYGGFITVFPLLLGEIFGLEHFSKYVGVFGLVQVLSLAFGIVCLGRIYDTSGSYVGAIQLLMILAVVGTIAAILVSDPRKKLQ